MEIEFNGTTLQVPTSWAEIKLGDYEKWFMRQPETRLEFAGLVADICKVETALLLTAPGSDFDVVVGMLSFVTDQDFAPENKVEIEGEEYRVSFSDELTLAEWIDVETVLDSDSETKISEVLAILCRPAGEKYDTKISESRRDTFRNLSCEKVMPLIAFFLRRKAESGKILHLCSTVKDRTALLLKDISLFAANGGGIKSLPIWQRIKYAVLLKFLKRRLSKFSDSFSTAWTKPQPKRNRRNLSNR